MKKTTSRTYEEDCPKVDHMKECIQDYEERTSDDNFLKKHMVITGGYRQKENIELLKKCKFKLQKELKKWKLKLIEIDLSQNAFLKKNKEPVEFLKKLVLNELRHIDSIDIDNIIKDMQKDPNIDIQQIFNDISKILVDKQCVLLVWMPKQITANIFNDCGLEILRNNIVLYAEQKISMKLEDLNENNIKIINNNIIEYPNNVVEYRVLFVDF